MIFVCVGSREYKFDRLIKYIDLLKKKELITNEIFMQIGTSKYIPENCDYVRFMNKEDFDRKVEDASIVISHAGVGIIMECLKKRKKIIIVPRRRKYKEHIDDHQMEICKVLEEELYVDSIAYEMKQIETKLKSNIYISNKKFESFIENLINEFIEDNEGRKL